MTTTGPIVACRVLPSSEGGIAGKDLLLCAAEAAAFAALKVKDADDTGST